MNSSIEIPFVDYLMKIFQLRMRCDDHKYVLIWMESVLCHGIRLGRPTKTKKICVRTYYLID
jgi:hypothetical protein